MLRRESGPPRLQPSGDMGKWSFVATDCMVTPLTPSCTRRHHGQAPKSVNLSSQSWNQCVCDCRTDFFKHSEARRTSAVRRGAGSGAAERGGGHRQSLAPAECGENRAPLLSHVYMPLLLSPYDLRVCPKCIRTHYVRTLPKPHDPETTCSEKLALPISGHKTWKLCLPACVRVYVRWRRGAGGPDERPPASGRATPSRPAPREAVAGAPGAVAGTAEASGAMPGPEAAALWRRTPGCPAAGAGPRRCSPPLCKAARAAPRQNPNARATERLSTNTKPWLQALAHVHVDNDAPCE